jgi:hypothetical protein
MDDKPRSPLISGGAVVSLFLTAALLYAGSLALRFLGVERLHPGAVVALLPVFIAAGVVIALVVVISRSEWKRRRALDRERRGLCVRCGYDHDHCPECGILILRRKDPVTGKELD